MDKELSDIFFRYIRVVENRLKNSFANCVAKIDKYYLQNPAVYKNQKSRFMRTKHVFGIENRPNKAYLQHYVNNGNHIPVWALVKSFSFGDLLYYIDSFKDIPLIKDILQTAMNSPLHP